MKLTKKLFSLLLASCVITSTIFSMQPGGGLKSKLEDLRDKLVTLREKLDGKPEPQLIKLPASLEKVQMSPTVAIDLPNEIKTQLEEAQAGLNRQLNSILKPYGLEFDATKMLHMTLTYLDKFPANKMNLVTQALNNAISTFDKTQPFTITLPQGNRPILFGQGSDTIVCEVNCSDTIKKLVTSFENALGAIGIPVRFKGNFKAHISLGKIKIFRCQTTQKPNDPTKQDQGLFNNVATSKQLTVHTGTTTLKQNVTGQSGLLPLVTNALNSIQFTVASGNINACFLSQYSMDQKHDTIFTFPLD